MLREVSRRVFGSQPGESCYHNCFVLEGGYKNFIAHYAEDCEGGYVPELDDDFRKMRAECKKRDKQFEQECSRQKNKARWLIPPQLHPYFRL